MPVYSADLGIGDQPNQGLGTLPEPIPSESRTSGRLLQLDLHIADADLDDDFRVSRSTAPREITPEKTGTIDVIDSGMQFGIADADLDLYGSDRFARHADLHLADTQVDTKVRFDVEYLQLSDAEIQFDWQVARLHDPDFDRRAVIRVLRKALEGEIKEVAAGACIEANVLGAFSAFPRRVLTLDPGHDQDIVAVRALDGNFGYRNIEA